MISPLAFIEGVGGPELMMIMFIVLVLFGANRLPELARGLGKSVREFKKAASGVEDEVRRALEEAPPPPRKPVGAIATSSVGRPVTPSPDHPPPPAAAAPGGPDGGTR